MEQTAMESAPLLNEESGDGDLVIPSWDNLVNHYESRWRKEKEKFQLTLKKNFKTLVERFACGKQELYSLCCPERLEKNTRLFLNYLNLDITSCWRCRTTCRKKSKTSFCNFTKQLC